MLGTSKVKQGSKEFQLFITTAPIPDLSDNLIVFGRVVKGEDIVQVWTPVLVWRCHLYNILGIGNLGYYYIFRKLKKSTQMNVIDQNLQLGSLTSSWSMSSEQLSMMSQWFCLLFSLGVSNGTIKTASRNVKFMKLVISIVDAWWLLIPMSYRSKGVLVQSNHETWRFINCMFVFRILFLWVLSYCHTWSQSLIDKCFFLLFWCSVWIR